jgi:hypothetical protein
VRKPKRQRWWNIPENLKMFRGPGRCSWCGKHCITVPHHIFAKGMGGNRPPGDARINLIAVGAELECPCHTFIHSDARTSPGKKKRQLIDLVAAREGALPFEILEALCDLSNCTKDTTLEQLEEKGLLQWVRGGIGSFGSLTKE